MSLVCKLKDHLKWINRCQPNNSLYCANCYSPWTIYLTLTCDKPKGLWYSTQSLLVSQGKANSWKCGTECISRFSFQFWHKIKLGSEFPCSCEQPIVQIEIPYCFHNCKAICLSTRERSRCFGCQSLVEGASHPRRNFWWKIFLCRKACDRDIFLGTQGLEIRENFFDLPHFSKVRTPSMCQPFQTASLITGCLFLKHG